MTIKEFAQQYNPTEVRTISLNISVERNGKNVAVFNYTTPEEAEKILAAFGVKQINKWEALRIKHKFDANGQKDRPGGGGHKLRLDNIGTLSAISGRGEVYILDDGDAEKMDRVLTELYS